MKTKTKQLEIMHSPRLATVLMVEKTLKDVGEVIKVAELKRRLPKKIMHSTLLQILDYLQASGKIIMTSRGVLWTYAPREELEKWIKGGLEL